MLGTLAFVLTAVTAADTTIVLGATSRDLTGDGRPERLTLTGVGPSTDSLNVTLTIASGDSVVYSARLRPLSRRKYVQDIKPYLGLSYEAWLKDLGASFFDPRKFLTPGRFTEQLAASAREHVDLIPRVIARDAGFARDTTRAATIWSEIQSSGVTIFEYSPGGDVFTALGWHARTRRFYRLVECC